MPRVQAPVPEFAFEREPGAASAALTRRCYRRRRPETTVLHRVVREHLNSFLAQAEARSSAASGYPIYIEREFRRYLDCGILSKGFARLRCPTCKTERLVAFSCKGRMCPSCWARRAAATAADLVDRQLPVAAYRQWVLTFPWELRFKLAVDKRFLSKVLRAFMLTLFAWQRRRGRQQGLQGQTGAVTFIQRFGGALNLNPHFHCLLPDGLFVPGDNGQLRFEELPAPTDDDVRAMLEPTAAPHPAVSATRTGRWPTRLGR